jgi:hypothetical protein
MKKLFTGGNEANRPVRGPEVWNSCLGLALYTQNQPAEDSLWDDCLDG